MLKSQSVFLQLQRIGSCFQSCLIAYGHLTAIKPSMVIDEDESLSGAPESTRHSTPEIQTRCFLAVAATRSVQCGDVEIDHFFLLG